MTDREETHPRVRAQLQDGEALAVQGPAVAVTLALPGRPLAGAGTVALTDRRLLLLFEEPHPQIGDGMRVPFSELRKVDVLPVPLDVEVDGGALCRVIVRAPQEQRGQLTTADGEPTENFALDLVVAPEVADGIARWFATIRQAR